MGIKVLNTKNTGPRTKVLLEITPPTEIRDGNKVEVVRSTDEFHRISRELMKHLGYRWVGGDFAGEIWFIPTDRDSFGPDPVLIEVTYRYVITAITLGRSIESSIELPEGAITTLPKPTVNVLPMPMSEEPEAAE